ncbi:hypothetical protein WJ0W_002614 [Paenibacillus melissococcoides]|uniref:Uncharacterized protein n=1 Tax=Paenibacillus melissococcoides TaxID=2912268 RepID=A0ABM9G1A5_9BACL|nr:MULTISPECIES: hypothetical protein [Paenibacillus]MEB9894502.1 hypothetical protein [Bacillus cereus]CAH8245379.1 hypothetical protein WJ0W_002614 [Paenibacillus melissococcoides]CAH8710785.1 hypothetical protein WDD9_002694 [Paenibacillus melissococcoides]CAH8711571.1 hypothetical protein HTL2_002995 [Paenibacillus melissococcoides]GIO77721.1 hypothetical protein J6TS7_13310 [Paenibacillus dendritiformis]
MTNRYLKFGISIDDMELVSRDLQNLLNIRFEEHESSYWGEYCLAQLSETESIRLIYYYIDDDWQEEEFKEYPLLLEFNRINEPEQILFFLCDNLSYIFPLYMDEIEAKVSSKRYTFQNGKFKLEYEHLTKKKDEHY